MTLHHLAALLAAACGLCACAPLEVTLLPEVGPQAIRARGTLVVNSSTREFNDAGVWRYPHTEYTLFSADGRFLRGVRNHIGDRDETAAEVSLPPGRYFVVAESETQGLVRVPVRIANGRLTVVELERPRRK